MAIANATGFAVAADRFAVGDSSLREFSMGRP